MDKHDAQTIVDACQLLDSVKADWSKSGEWSAWDQSVRDRLSAMLAKSQQPQLPCDIHPHLADPGAWCKVCGRSAKGVMANIDLVHDCPRKSGAVPSLGGLE